MQTLFPEDPACWIHVGTVIDWNRLTTSDMAIATPPKNAAISLGHGSRLPGEIRAVQLNDADIKPVIEWMEENGEKLP